jgi:hypothetical protein
MGRNRVVGRAPGTLLVRNASSNSVAGDDGEWLREPILRRPAPYVGSTPSHLVVLGIPVIHLTVWPQKRMAAMTVHRRPRCRSQPKTRYPAPIAFYLAHELAMLLCLI